MDEYISHHSPLIGADGTIYMTDFDGLYAIYGPAPASQTSPWSTFSHDVLRTGNAGFDPRRHAVPTGVTASKGTHPTSVAVTWNPIPNAIHYEVWRSANDNPATAQLHRRLITTELWIKTLPGPNLLLLGPAKTHVALLSDFSDSDFGGAPPRRPQGVTATKGIPTNYVQVTWQPSAYAVCYDIYRSTTNHANTAQYVTTIATTNYDDYDVQAYPGRSHYYWIKASNNVAWVSPFSAGDGVTNAGGIPPDSPTNLIAGKGLTSTNVPLNWDVANYDVTAPSFTGIRINLQEAVPIATNGAVTTYNDRGSVPFRPYYYWVGHQPIRTQRIQSHGLGYTTLLPPFIRHATVALTNRIYITWEIESTNATSYKFTAMIHLIRIKRPCLVEVPYNKPEIPILRFQRRSGQRILLLRTCLQYIWESDFSPPSQIGGTFPLPPSNLRPRMALSIISSVHGTPRLLPGARLQYTVLPHSIHNMPPSRHNQRQCASMISITNSEAVLLLGRCRNRWVAAGSAAEFRLASTARACLVLATSGTSTNGISNLVICGERQPLRNLAQYEK